ncbi:hypothetical protein Tco_0516621 [Tanacetum coccineum]
MYPLTFCLRKTSASKWVSRKGKPKLRRRNQSKARCKKHELDGRNLSYSMAHRTMIKSSNGDTPFSLTYGTEAVIPTETGMPILRTAKVDMV